MEYTPFVIYPLYVPFIEHNTESDQKWFYYFSWDDNYEELEILKRDVDKIHYPGSYSNHKFTVDLKEKTLTEVLDWIDLHKDKNGLFSRNHVRKIKGKLKWSSRIQKETVRTTLLSLVNNFSYWKKCFVPFDTPPKKYLKVSQYGRDDDGNITLREFYVQLNGNEEEILKFYVDLMNHYDSVIYDEPRFEIDLFEQYTLPQIEKQECVNGEFIYSETLMKLRNKPSFLYDNLKDGHIVLFFD